MEGLAVAAALLALWAVGIRYKLKAMDKAVDNAMGQIGAQLCSRFDAFAALLGLAKACGGQGSEALLKAIQSHRGAIGPQSTANEVAAQEAILTEALGYISMAKERYPELKADVSFKQAMEEADRCEKMARNSRLVYNDSVTRLNRAIRTFPTSLLAPVLGFQKRPYLEAVSEKLDLPSGYIPRG